MSYDVSIGKFDANYTSNLSEFFYDHIVTDDCVRGLPALDGTTGAEASRVLARAFTRAQDTRRRTSDESMRSRYEPQNGWGSLIGALILIGELMAECSASPHERVSVQS